MSAKKAVGSVALVLVIWFCLVLRPCTQRKIVGSNARDYSANRIKLIALAILGYHDCYKKLPPAVVRNKNGQPLYSWRVAILPFLEQAPLYNEFNHEEPWDSLHNKAITTETPPCFYHWDGPPGTTGYQAFVGPGTAFERDGLTLNDFPDGASQTILVVEAGTPVPWAKPVDLVHDPKGPLPSLGMGFTKPRLLLCYETSRTLAFHAGFADGSFRLLRTTLSEVTLRALITRNGGETIDLAELER